MENERRAISPGNRISWPGGALLAPVPPALVACRDGENINVLTVAWTGIVCSKPPVTYISLRPQRLSHGMIMRSGEFTINLPAASMARAVDLCGVKSGRDTDKLSLCGLKLSQGQNVAAPVIDGCPVSLECRVRSVMPLGSHDMFLADIVGVSVAAAFVDKNGRLMAEKCDFLAYAHGAYFSLGKQLGTFGFSVKKPRRAKK